MDKGTAWIDVSEATVLDSSADVMDSFHPSATAPSLITASPSSLSLHHKVCVASTVCNICELFVDAESIISCC